MNSEPEHPNRLTLEEQKTVEREARRWFETHCGPTRRSPDPTALWVLGYIIYGGAGVGSILAADLLVLRPLVGLISLTIALGLATRGIGKSTYNFSSLITTYRHRIAQMILYQAPPSRTVRDEYVRWVFAPVVLVGLNTIALGLAAYFAGVSLDEVLLPYGGAMRSAPLSLLALLSLVPLIFAAGLKSIWGRVRLLVMSRLFVVAAGALSAVTIASNVEAAIDINWVYGCLLIGFGIASAGIATMALLSVRMLVTFVSQVTREVDQSSDPPSGPHPTPAPAPDEVEDTSDLTE